MKTPLDAVDAMAVFTASTDDSAAASESVVMLAVTIIDPAEILSVI